MDPQYQRNSKINQQQAVSCVPRPTHSCPSGLWSVSLDALPFILSHMGLWACWSWRSFLFYTGRVGHPRVCMFDTCLPCGHVVQLVLRLSRAGQDSAHPKAGVYSFPLLPGGPIGPSPSIASGRAMRPRVRMLTRLSFRNLR